MKFETIEVSGWKGALWGLRLPMSKDLDDAKSKSDSFKPYCSELREYVEESCNYDACGHTCRDKNNHIGKDDLRIAQNLIKADDKVGVCQPNSKFLQMIEVWVSIEAPLAFWKEADTYRHTVKNSTSTMHKIQSCPITKNCFEPNPITGKCSVLKETIDYLEGLRQKYNETKDKSIWYDLIYNLPDSWLQTRMFHTSYATLRNMVTWRINHKQQCWSGKDNHNMQSFIAWAKTLPYADELIFYNDTEESIQG